MSNLRVSVPTALLLTALLLLVAPFADASYKTYDTSMCRSDRRPREPRPSDPPRPPRRPRGGYPEGLVEHYTAYFQTDALPCDKPCDATKQFCYKQLYFFLKMWEEPKKYSGGKRTKRSLLAYLDVSLDDYCGDPSKDFTYPYGCAKMRIDKDYIQVSEDAKTAKLLRPLKFSLGACTGFAYYWNNAAPTPPPTCDGSVKNRVFCPEGRSTIDDKCAFEKSYWFASWKGRSFDRSRYDCCTGAGYPLKNVKNQLSGTRVEIRSLESMCDTPRPGAALPSCDRKRDKYFSLGEACSNFPSVNCDGEPSINPPSKLTGTVEVLWNRKPLDAGSNFRATQYYGFKVPKEEVCGSGGNDDSAFCPAGSGSSGGGICA